MFNVDYTDHFSSVRISNKSNVKHILSPKIESNDCSDKYAPTTVLMGSQILFLSHIMYRENKLESCKVN